MTSALTHVPAAAVVPSPIVLASAFDHPSPARPAGDRVAIDVELPEDAEARESLLDRAFGPGRFAKTCERLRAGRLPALGLSLVARTQTMEQGLGGGADGGGDSVVVGTVRLWHVSAGGVPALMLGPLAVEAAWRCHRLGGGLMEEAIRRAETLGHRAILLVGDAPYYARFGFERRCTLGLRMPGPVEAGRFLGLELQPDALAGARGLVQATGAVDLGSRLRFRSRRKSLRRAA